MIIKLEQVHDVLLTAVAETMEGIAFLEVTPAPGDEWDFSGFQWAAIGVHAPVEGRIELGLPDELADEIVMTLYMGDDDPSLMEKRRGDILNEMLNTIAGRMMTLLVDPDESLKLGLPERVECLSCDEASFTRFCFNAGEAGLVMRTRGFPWDAPEG